MNGPGLVAISIHSAVTSGECADPDVPSGIGSVRCWIRRAPTESVRRRRRGPQYARLGPGDSDMRTLTGYIMREPGHPEMCNRVQQGQTHTTNTPNMEQVPRTMRALVAPKHCRPDGYEVMQLPLPELTEPNQVLIRIHAAAMQTGDCQLASGSGRMFLSIRSVPTLPCSRYTSSHVCNFRVPAAPLTRLAGFQ